jgi:nicotinate-nucleotide adenylyltransferase
MPEPHYTIRTLDALKAREPENSFTLVIGADNLADIRRWRDYDRILGEYGVAVFPRTGHDLEEIKADLITENPSFKIELLEAEMVDISSTIIRDAMAEGSDASRWLM